MNSQSRLTTQDRQRQGGFKLFALIIILLVIEQLRSIVDIGHFDDDDY